MRVYPLQEYFSWGWELGGGGGARREPSFQAPCQVARPWEWPLRGRVQGRGLGPDRALDGGAPPAEEQVDVLHGPELGQVRPHVVGEDAAP